MPRRRPQIQSTDETTPTSTTPKRTVKKATDATPTAAVETESTDDVSPVVEEPEKVEKSPVTASKTISTDVGPVETKEEPQPFAPHWTAPDGLILQANEDVRIEGDDYGNYIVVKRDVYREVYPRGAKRPSYFLLYAKGSQVLKSTLTALN